jgi:hypothetical protein
LANADSILELNMDNESIKLIKTESKSSGCSTNEYLQKIVKDYLEYGRIEENVNVMLFRAPFVDATLNRIREKDIISLGREIGSYQPRRMLSGLGLNPSPDNMVKLVQLLSSRNHWFNVEIIREENNLVLELTHEMKKKWSLFLSEFFSEMFRDYCISIETQISSDFKTKLEFEYFFSN